MKNSSQRAEEADAVGDKGLAVALDALVRDEMEPPEERERILHKWPLE